MGPSALRWNAAASAVACLSIVAGCGSSEPASTEQAAPRTQAHQNDVTRLLIGPGDLKGFNGIGKTPPEICGPLQMLETADGRVALSRTFIVPQAQISEAIGIYPDSSGAASAYRKLNARSRLNCLRDAAARAAPNLHVHVSRGSINAGEAATRSRYHLVRSGGKTQGFVELMTIKLGKCAASLLVGNKGDKPPTRATDSAIGTAVNLLAGPCK